MKSSRLNSGCLNTLTEIVKVLWHDVQQFVTGRVSQNGHQNFITAHNSTNVATNKKYHPESTKKHTSHNTRVSRRRWEKLMLTAARIRLFNKSKM